MSLINTNVTVLEVNQNTINKPFEVGYKGDHNAYKLVFSDLVGDGYSVLFWKPMSNHCVFVPLVNNEWLLGNEVLSTSGTLYCQVVKKDESNNFIKHSQVFMLSVNESAPCTQQAFEEVPPNFKIAYDEMVAITKKVNEALTSGKFNGLSAYELAVKNGFKGTEAEWIESLKYWNSPEFTKLAEQVRADKEHVDTVVAEFDTKANQANTDFDTKVNTANTEFDKKVTDANNAFDEKVKTANDAFDKKVTDADTNFTGKVNKANTDLDTKVTQINQDLDAKEAAINQALDAKITEANSVIDTNVQESATSAENAKKSELKAQSIADNMQGLTNAFRIDTSEQGRVITATDSSESVINGLKVFGESTQEDNPTPENPSEIISKTINEITVTSKNLFDISKIKTNYDYSTGGIINNGNGSLYVRNIGNDITVNTDITLQELCPTLKVGDTAVLNYKNKNYPSDCKFYLSAAKYIWQGKTSLVIQDIHLKSKIKMYPSSNKNTSSTLSDIQIEYGDAATAYSPFREPQIVKLSKPIKFNGIKVPKEGTISIDGQQYFSDLIDVEKGKLIKKIGTYTFTGTEGMNDEWLPTIVINLPKKEKQGLFISGVSLPSAYFFLSFSNSTGRVFGFNTNVYTSLNSVEKLRQFLTEKYNSDNKVTVYYPLVTPVEVDLPTQDQQALKALKSNYPTTAITNDNNAFMQLDYVADTKNYIDNRLSEIKTAIIASKGV